MGEEIQMTGVEAATTIAKAIAHDINYHRFWGNREKEDALIPMLSAIVEHTVDGGFGVFQGTKDELMEELVAIIQKEEIYRD
jgi:hypothetical protein